VKETRKLPRRHTPFYLKVFRKDTHEFTGSLVDLTVKGMKLFSWEPLETDTVFQCEVILPDDSCGRKQIELDARCVWCQEYAEPDIKYYEIGFELIDVSEENLAIIQDTLQKFFFRSDEIGGVGVQLDTVVD
jgi:hypothetical protein